MRGSVPTMQSSSHLFLSPKGEKQQLAYRAKHDARLAASPNPLILILQLILRVVSKGLQKPDSYSYIMCLFSVYPLFNLRLLAQKIFQSDRGFFLWYPSTGPLLAFSQSCTIYMLHPSFFIAVEYCCCWTFLPQMKLLERQGVAFNLPQPLLFVII